MTPEPRSPRRPPRALPSWAPLVLTAAFALPVQAQHPPVCLVRAAGPPPLVVELYTSEGCSSCPPAEAWLNGLKKRADVLPLAIHVNYWDYLGWTDRFATAEGSERQRQLARHDGERAVYTPQVRVAGRDWRRWPSLPAAAGQAGPGLLLQRSGDVVTARVQARAAPDGAAPSSSAAGAASAAQLAGYWVVLEDAHSSRVRGGENSGRTLVHDHVVRLLRPLPAWPAALPYSAQLQVSRGAAEHPRRVAFVIVDPRTQKPLQAAVLDC